MNKIVVKKLIAFLIAALIFSCSSEISVLVKNATYAYNEGKYLTTLFFTEQALEENPNDKDALLIAAKALIKLEEFEEADKKLDNLLSLSDEPELLFLKSQIKIELGDFESALSYLNEYINLDSEQKNEFSFFNIAYCYYQLGDYESALKYYRIYSFLKPQDKEGYLNIAYLFGYLGNSDSAITYYDKVLLLDSTNYNALYNRSIEFQFQKKYKNAANDLELLKQFYPNNIDVLMDLAKVRIKEKKYFLAINDLTKVIIIDSTIAEAYFTRGKALLELARNFSACADFIKAGELGYFEAYEMIAKYCTKKETK